MKLYAALMMVLVSAGLPGCILTDGNSSQDSDVVANVDVDYPDVLNMGGVWKVVKGPCPGSETNALWFDNRQIGWVGCGQNAEGHGLYRTTDGGLTWESLDFFSAVRVNDIRRGPDGVLYGAGFHTIEGYSAFKIDESGAPKPEGLFQPGDNAFAKVAQGENIAVTEDGQMLVDSLTGVPAAYKPVGADFTEYECLGEEAIADPEAPGFQVRRIQAIENKFYATGSLINLPGMVYLPSKLEGATFHMQAVALQNEKEDGEILDMHLWAPDHILVAGIDQSYYRPLIFIADGDPYVMSNWTRIDVRDSGIDYEAGINGIHVTGDVVVAVGEKVPSALGGFVMISADGGKTWSDITPSDDSGSAGPLSKAWRFPNGDMVIGGGGYEMWIYTAP